MKGDGGDGGFRSRSLERMESSPFGEMDMALLS